MKAWWWVLGVWAMVACAPGGSESDGTEEPSTGPQAMASAPAKFFDQTCASCHGVVGTLEPGYASTLDDDERARMVDQMMGLYAAKPLEGAERNALVALVRAIGADEPYLAYVVSEEGEPVLETLPETTIAIGGEALEPIAQSDYRWLFAAPPELGVVRVTRGEKAVELDLSTTRFTPGLELSSG